MSQRCVTLVGMMGAGKSSVGEGLADSLGYKFVDTDQLVEQKSGKKVRRIFAEDGEDAFRGLERQVITSLAGSTSLVISSGGGAFLDKENRQVLNSLGLTVYLKASPREIYQRIKNDNTRPILQSGNPQEEIRTILAEREFYYDMASFSVDTEDLSVEEVVERIIDELARRTLGDG